ncbi:MAG TPA: hypothetical protein DDW68_10935 [Verrucomicrobiales bacterium]|nr:hypothetical protein [Verrucomicrobiales bacterium]
MKKNAKSLSALALIAITGHVSAAALQVNFTANLTSYTGPANLDPLDPNSALGAFAAGGNGQEDVLRLDGQFYIPDWDGSDGTYTTNSAAGGNRFFLHSAFIERIEGQTWRYEGASNNGTTVGTGDAISQRKKLLLPTDTTYGTATLVVAGGVPTSVSYALDFAADNAPQLDSGDGLSALFGPGVSYGDISISTPAGTDFGSASVFAAGADDAVAYGLNTALDLAAYAPNVKTSTTFNTTRGLIRNELTNNVDEINGNTPNVSKDGQLDGQADGTATAKSPNGSFYLQDPIAGENGVTVFTVGSDLNAGIGLIPEPSTALLSGLALLFGLGRRSRK